MKTKLHTILVTVFLFSIPILNFGQAPDLNTCADFILFSSSGGITNTGVSQILGGAIGTDLGALTGFDDVNCVKHIANDETAQCKLDLQAVYDEISAIVPTATITAASLNGATLTPGIYQINEAVALATNLTLDALDNPDALFIFKFTGAFSTAASINILLINGASVNNIFWHGTAAIGAGAGASLKGTFMTNAGAIALGAGASLEGRALTVDGEVTMSGSTLTGCIMPEETTVTLTQPTYSVATGTIEVTAPIGEGITYSIDGADFTNTTGLFTLVEGGDYTVTSKNSDGCISWTNVTLVSYVHISKFGTVADFVLFTSSGAVGNTGANSFISGGAIGTNLGAITGFDDVDCVKHIQDAATAQCKLDLQAAFDEIGAIPTNDTITAASLSGGIITAGVHQINSAAAVSIDLTLNAENDPNAQFIFKVKGAFSLAANVDIILINGATVNNVFWNVDGAVSAGAGASMKGTFLALAGEIALGDGASLIGRALTIAGAISIYNSDVWSGELTWNGSIDSDWHTAGNWDPNIIPTASDNVTIPAGLANYPTLSSAGACNNLTIKSTSGSTGSIIGQSNLAVNSVTIEHYLTASQWHIVAPPVAGQVINSFLIDTANSIAVKDFAVDSFGVTTYNEAQNNWDDYFTQNTNGEFSSGTGYLFRRQTTPGTVTFTGTLATGSVSVPVTFAGVGFGWNCVGNPYPSAIGVTNSATSTANFLGINTAILDDSFEALYVWDPGTGNYVIINNAAIGNGTEGAWATNYIQSGQGFIVRANAVGNVSFTTDMQIHQPTQVFKSAEILWPEMILTVDRNGEKTSTTLAFNEEMTESLDPGYDAGIFKGGNDLNLFTQLIEDNGVEFGLQCLPLQNLETIEIPIGLDATVGGEITLSLQKANFTSSLIPVLNDKLLNTKFVFQSESDVYTTSINDNTKGFGRFTLTFSSTTNAETILAGQAHFKAWHSNGFIYISGEIQGNAQATVYDINGRKLAIRQLQQGMQNQITVPQNVAGLYLVKVEDARRSEVLKVPVFGRK